MFFAPHLAHEAEDEALAEAEAAATTTPTDSRKKVEDDGCTRVVGTVERVQVELSGSAVPGSNESVTLPDGRVVQFTIPATFSPGEIIEVEVARQRFQEVSKEELKKFFANGVAAMQSAEGRREVEAGRCIEVIVEVQQREFDKLDIDRKTGCQAAGRQFDDDEELRNLQQKFMRTAQVEFIRALEAKKLKPGRKEMSKQDILDFFQACNTKITMDDVKKRLADDARRHKRVPNELMIKIQREMLETLGFQADFGCDCLNRIQTTFGQDPDIANGMRQWAMQASQACKLAQQEADPSLQPDSKSMQEMEHIQSQAASKLQGMSQAERTALLDRMSQKVQIFQKLSAPDRLRYINKLDPKDKVEFVMSQNLLMAQMHAQMASMNLA